VIAQQLVDVEASLGDEPRIRETRIAEQVERRQERSELRVEARVQVTLNLLNSRLELLGRRPLLGIDGVGESRLKSTSTTLPRTSRSRCVSSSRPRCALMKPPRTNAVSVFGSSDFRLVRSLGSTASSDAA
jgi:hypothetical protein